MVDNTDFEADIKRAKAIRPEDPFADLRSQIWNLEMDVKDAKRDAEYWRACARVLESLLERALVIADFPHERHPDAEQWQRDCHDAGLGQGEDPKG